VKEMRMTGRGRLGVTLLFGLALAGCAAQGPYRHGEKAIERFVADPALCPELKGPSSFRIPVAYVEIDEQGVLQDRSQVEQALALVGDGARPKYVVVFVHGWFHNADPDDLNVRRFKCALNNLQGIADNAGEDVVGVYVGWRGKSWSIPLVEYATFWDRKNTSDEVGRGSLVEFLMRLEGAVKPDRNTLNKLMVVGHSFGASVVFNSIGQTLLARFVLDAERLAHARPAPVHAQSKPGLVSGYGDLVVLVNPAIEATRIVPFFATLNEYTRKQTDLLSPAQPARLVILSSKGDWATRATFPAARFFSTLLESYQDSRMTTPYGQDIPMRERYLDWQTMGNARTLQTHQPLRRTAPAPWDGKCPPARPDWLRQAIDERKAEQRRKREPETGAGWSTVFDGTGVTVAHQGITTPSNPLWILGVDTELIPSHSGIGNPVVICLFNELLGDPKVINPEGQKQEERLRRSR
jgi:pimeloyl-ACP methyl ester carboxylesterase